MNSDSNGGGYTSGNDGSSSSSSSSVNVDRGVLVVIIKGVVVESVQLNLIPEAKPKFVIIL